MRLGYFTMPLHPPDRRYEDVLREDRDAIILADQLGYAEAFIGEHATDPYERITSSLLFIASLANVTSNIKLGCGTINLPNGHPAQFAAQIAMLDHMLEGRFILGISPGALQSDAEIFGVLDQDRGAMFEECINHILDLWTQPAPYDLQGRFWELSTARTIDPGTEIGVLPVTYQKPHPPIVCAALAPFSEGVAKAAARGWHPMSSNFLQASGVASHWTRYVEGRQSVGAKASAADWRVARAICVADDDKTAVRYAKSQSGPYALMVNQIHQKLKKAGRLGVMKTSAEQPDNEITPAFALETLVIAGSVNSVVDQLLEFHEQTGDFGTLLYVGVDWQDTNLGRRSMELMATDVMAEVNRALDSKEESSVGG